MDTSGSKNRLIMNLKKIPEFSMFIQAAVNWLYTERNMDIVSDYIENQEKPDFYDVMDFVIKTGETD